MASTKLSAFLSLLLVFASGIVVGGVGYRVYNTKVSPPPRPQEKRSPEEFLKRAISEMTREVHLDDAQVAQLKQIYQDTFAAFDQKRAEHNAKLKAEGQAIHDQQVEKIKAILRPDQIPLYEALRARHDAERAARHKGDIRKDQ
ncbi:MAG TPA: hypothetical protein VMB03_14385 [Bryobacteraceae bacterium]|nr:hypothetical protein [Bryobacteraceae bacterium]